MDFPQVDVAIVGGITGWWKVCMSNIGRNLAIFYPCPCVSLSMLFLCHSINVGTVVLTVVLSRRMRSKD